MVGFDNTIFCLAIHPNAKPPDNVDRAKDRIEYLLDQLRERGERVLIATPVLSEFLVFAGTDGPAYMAAIRDNSIFRIEPFDERAAIENAEMETVARAKGQKRGSASDAPWQKVKVDRQIVAIGKAHGVSCIYSDDEHVVKLCQDCGMQVMGLLDLPIPPAVQTEMFKDPLADLSNVSPDAETTAESESDSSSKER